MGSPTSSVLAGLPEQFGKYSILGHLATGGMAEVYIARQSGIQGFEKIVVIKRVRAELEGDAAMTGSFLDEARLVATLEHPNIAQVHEIGLVNGSYFFVMEYVHGADLRRLMERSLRQKQAVPVGEAVYIASHVCAGLHSAHEKCDLDGNPLHIIHRDVSPSNVLLSHDGAVKLCDFGIAKAQGRSTETQRGVLKGKYSYMSPEQCRCEELDRRSDIFSLGIVLYELTTLSRLFKAPNDFELMRSIIEAHVPLPSSRVPGYPAELERIVMRALQPRREDRYQTAQEMQLDLETFALENRLPQSSVHLAKLMGGLFEKRVEAWSRAQRQGKDLEGFLVDTELRRMSGELPVFMPLGSDELDVPAGDSPTIEVTPSSRERGSATPLPGRGSRSTLEAPPLERPGAARPSPMWLIAAMVAGLAAGGATLAGRALSKDQSKEATVAFEADAEKLAGAFDSAARSGHLRADGIAAAPVLRAAIGTDAATMKDVVTNEYVFTPSQGEVLEIFQVVGKQLVSLVRLPAGAAPLDALQAGQARVDITQDHAAVEVSAPVAGQKASAGGVLVVSTPVDLSAARQSLASHAAAASLTGFGKTLSLLHTPAPGGAPIAIALPSSGDWNVPAARLSAVPIAASAGGRAWVAPVRWGCVALAGMFVLIFFAGWRQTARERARTQPIA